MSANADVPRSRFHDAAVHCLFNAGCPSAIVWRVTLACFDAVDGQIVRVSVGKRPGREGAEIETPFFADSDSTLAVFEESIVVAVVTATNHLVPDAAQAADRRFQWHCGIPIFATGPRRGGKKLLSQADSADSYQTVGRNEKTSVKHGVQLRRTLAYLVIPVKRFSCDFSEFARSGRKHRSYHQ